MPINTKKAENNARRQFTITQKQIKKAFTINSIGNESPINAKTQKFSGLKNNAIYDKPKPITAMRLSINTIREKSPFLKSI